MLFIAAIPSVSAATTTEQQPLIPPPIFTDLTPLPTPTHGVGQTPEPSMTVGESTLVTSTLPELLKLAHAAQAELRIGIDETTTTKKTLDQMKMAREISFIFYDTETKERIRVDGLFDGISWKPTVYTSKNFPEVKVVLKGLSSFTYSYPGNRYIMLAVRYPKWTEILKEKKRIGVHESIRVKTPYQKEFSTPDIALAGEEMLRDIVDSAVHTVRERNVLSKAKPGALLADVANKDLVLSLYIIEHSSSKDVSTRSEAVIDRFMVQHALNPENAFSDQQSYMGAQGIAQFMPATYASLAKRKDLGLIQDTTKGTRDVQNATVAAIAFVDAMQAELPGSLTTTSSIRLAEALAGSYNGGVYRVKTIMERDVWYDQIDGTLDRAAVKKRSRVPAETLDYVKKIRIILPAIQKRSQRQTT